MKNFYLLIAALLVVVMTSMMLTKKNDAQQTKSSTMEKSQPMFHKGMITIKVNAGIGEYVMQRGDVYFGIPSLDAKANQFEISLLEKRFKYNPEKLKDGMPDLSRIYRIEFPEEYSVTEVAREFSKDPNIEYSEPIPVNCPDDIPNDAFYGQCQHLPQIFAPWAWDIHHGEDGPEIVIAIIDNGVFWKHIDLTENIWQNLGEDFDGDGKTLELSGTIWVFDPDDENGVDDDGNGFIDDFIGWDFVANNNDPDHNSGEDHGTHTSGIAAGMTNNGVGIASIGWNVKTMPIQVANPEGYFVRAYDGIIYAAENGADFISNSWGGSYSQAGDEAVQYAGGLGSIVVASAGNSNAYLAHYPSDYIGVISVASVSVDDTKAGYSSFGPVVDISAPGGGWEGGILSTTPNNSYGFMSGTSMSCPLVAGCFGLLKSYHPDWTSEQLITQMLGTVDNIDTLNPNYLYLLGTGRINAFRSLADTNVSVPQELKLIITDIIPQDDNGNGMLEPGEEVNLFIKFRNYVPCVGEDNVTIIIESDDPEIIILDGSANVNIPPDGYFTVEDQFHIKVSEQASTHIAHFSVNIETNTPVVYFPDTTFELVIAPEGILVYQGEGTGNAFSGDYIYEFLNEQGLQVLYSSQFPFSLNGFDAVFLSYGNYGQHLSDGVRGTIEEVDATIEYLMNGGCIYAECGTFFGGMEFMGWPNLEEIMGLFGAEGVETPLTGNNINLLNGLSGSICEDLEFSGSSQSPNWYIDILTPNDNGVAAFEEDDYGTVAVQGDGEYGQKTFCFSYALAHLEDGEYPNTREELLHRICEFFDIIISNVETIDYQDVELNIFPNPTNGISYITYNTKVATQVELAIYDWAGKKIRTLVNKNQQPGEYTVRFDGSDLSVGVYLVRLQVGEQFKNTKLVLMR